MSSSESDCVFCGIVAGQIPSRQIAADEHAVAFLDLAPFQPGHTLVVPRRHVEDFVVGAGALTEIAPLVERTAVVLRQRLGAQGMNVFSSAGAVAGQEVFHLHVHLVPRYAARPGLRNLFGAKAESTDEALDAVRQQIQGDEIQGDQIQGDQIPGDQIQRDQIQGEEQR